MVLSMAKTYKPSEQHESLVSVAWDKYCDMRMAWVGRAGGFPRTYAITDASQLVVPVDENRVWVSLVNDGANPIYLNFGEAAIANSSYRLNANGGVLILDRTSPWPSSIFAVCGAGLTSTLLVNDVSQATESGRGE